MTREELDERLKNILGLDNWQYSTMPHEVEQLIRDCIEAVSPSRIDMKPFEEAAKNEPTLADSFIDQARRASIVNGAVTLIEANTKELLG